MIDQKIKSDTPNVPDKYDVVCINCGAKFGDHYCEVILGFNYHPGLKTIWDCPIYDYDVGLTRPSPEEHVGWFIDPKDVDAVQSGQPVNDYTCPIIKNNRCSKSEKLCWKCGNKL